MIVKKAGSILLDLANKKVGIVYRTKKDDYSFAKGHWEEGETLKECAIRETEEETCRKVKIIHEKEAMHTYITSSGKNVECYYYLTADMGPIDKQVAKELKEELIWLSPDDVKSKLSYDNLRDVWSEFEEIVFEILENVTPANLTDMGICPTCFNRNNKECLYGDNTDKILYEDEEIECFLVGNPRAEGHVAVSSKKHYKDMMEIPDELCDKVFKFAKKLMNIIKKVYESESVYLCTMCDGPMNHFHIQLIPRYSFEKRGSKNFVKERKEYVEDKEKLQKLRELLK